MAELTPADELRQAAKTLRGIYAAMQAERKPRAVTWFPQDALDGATFTGPDDDWLPHVLTTPQAEWIALMHPLLAEPLAAWLEQAATAYDDLVATDCGPAAELIYMEALAVARAINGSAS